MKFRTSTKQGDKKKNIILEKIQIPKVPKSSQDTVPFFELYQSGVISLGNNLYSKILSLGNVNFLFAKDEDKVSFYRRYCELLNSLSHDINIEIIINNVNVDESRLIESLKIERPDNQYSEQVDEYNSIMYEKIDECRNSTIEKQLYISITVTASNPQSALENLSVAIGNVMLSLKKIGSYAKELKAEEVITLLYEFYNPKERNKRHFFIHNNMFTKGINVKDVICPTSFQFKTNYAMMGECYTRTLFLRDYPTTLTEGFMNDILSCPFTYSTAIHIEPTNPTESIKNIKRRLTSMEENKIKYLKRADSKRDPYIPYELATSIDEAKELLNSITKSNQKMFLISFYINIVANTLEELEEKSSKIQSIARGHLFNCANLTHQQEDALTSAMPIGKNVIKAKRTLLTDSAGIFIPFTGEELFQRNGYYYGKNQITRGLIVLNRKELENPAGFILGRPRSGKSFGSKREIVNVLLSSNDDILVIDPEAEYTPLCELFGGQVIRIANNSTNYINPFDMDADYGAGENPIALKSDFILSMIECMAGSLSSEDKTIVDRCIHKVYQPFITNNFDQNYIPTMVDFYNILLEQKEPQAQRLALTLEIYVHGSLNMFSKKSNIEYRNRFTVFNTRDLGKQLKTLGMLICMDFIWNRVCHNWIEKKRTWVDIDEFYMYFYSELTASFFNEFYKRSQKRGAIPTGITQNVNEILNNPLASNMLSNSEFLMMYNQAPTDRDKLGALLKLSPLQLTYVTDPEEGCGLMYVKGKAIPFEDKFPKDTKLYKIITTKVTEIFQSSQEGEI